MKISTGHKGSAHKTIYVYNNQGHQLCHFGFDPYGDYGQIGPQFFWGVGNKHGRINMPHIKWNTKHPKWLSNFRQWQDKLWNKLDTRYSA